MIAPSHNYRPGPERDADFARLLQDKPEDQQAIWTEIYRLTCDIEDHLREIKRDVRDCNVILARTIDRCVRFEATGMPN